MIMISKVDKIIDEISRRMCIEQLPSHMLSIEANDSKKIVYVDLTIHNKYFTLYYKMDKFNADDTVKDIDALLGLSIVGVLTCSGRLD